MAGSARSRGTADRRRRGVALVVLGLFWAGLSTSACTAAPSEPQPRTTVTSTVQASVGPSKSTRLEGPDGVAIVVPAGVVSDASRVSITSVGTDTYDIHIAGSWTGAVQIEMPLVNGDGAIAHKVKGEWVMEKVVIKGDRAIAEVTSLSLFSNLRTCLEALVPPRPGAAVRVVKCLLRIGVKKLPDWLSKKLIGLFNDYDACKPISRTNWSIDLLELMTASCALSDPTVPVTPTPKPTATTPHEDDPPPPPPPPKPSQLSVHLAENPFLCDGTSHNLGTLSGARSGERITFSSPDVQRLLPGVANSSGRLTLRWQCDASDAGRTWTVTAHGATGGSVRFSVTGKAPTAPPPPPPPPPSSRGFTVEDAFLGGTWAKTDPWNGTWFNKASRPPNAAYWFPNGLGVAVDCTASAAGYTVSFVDGHKENWSWWAHVTDNTWVPVATLREVSNDGGQGLRTC